MDNRQKYFTINEKGFVVLRDGTNTKMTEDDYKKRRKYQTALQKEKYKQISLKVDYERYKDVLDHLDDLKEKDPGFNRVEYIMELIRKDISENS